MTEGIVVAMITGGLSILGVVITNAASNRKTDQKRQVDLAVIKQQIEDLTREVRMHNNFAQKIPVLEEKLKNLKYMFLDQSHNGKE